MSSIYTDVIYNTYRIYIVYRNYIVYQICISYYKIVLLLVHQRGYELRPHAQFCMIVQIYIAILSYIILPYSVIRPYHHAFVAKAFAWPVSMSEELGSPTSGPPLVRKFAHCHASCHPYVIARSHKSVMIASASLSTVAVAVISSPYLTKPSESRNS